MTKRWCGLKLLDLLLEASIQLALQQLNQRRA
jgi:hypothetical protein